MADFGKLNFAVAFNPQTAFPLDSRTLFYSLSDAQAAAASAQRAGSADTTYYYGMHLVVVDEEKGIARQYIIQANKTLKAIPFVDETGSGGVSYVIGEGLSLNNETNTLSVNKVDTIVEGDNRLATSDAVFQHVKGTVGVVNDVLSKV
jgi:hypothetical protein